MQMRVDAVDKINVIYDISVLGLAQVDDRARTGVFRVVENIAVRLGQSRDLMMRFCASIGNNKECLDFLKKHSFPNRYEKEFVPCVQSVLDNSSVNSGFWKKAIDLLCGKRESPLLYHSPYHPIPQDIRSRPDISKVLTVYDVIAVLLPDYFCEGGDLHCKEILKSITPDTTVICISEATKNDLCNLSTELDPERIFVTHLAASDMFYPCLDSVMNDLVRRKYAIPVDKRYLLSVCTLEPRKNIELVIRSFVRLVREQHLPDLCLVLTGTKGWKFERIFAEIEHAESLKERVIFTGYVVDEDLSPLYSGALAFVYPSLYEGFGLPPLEAMQCGTPVITSNSSSLPEVVGDAGVMINPKDSDALCHAILELYQDEDRRQMLRVKGLQQASRFSWQRCVAETIAIYRCAVDMSKA